MTQGVIIAEEYKEALCTVLSGLIREQENRDAAKQSAEMLGLWRKFLIGLRIREKIENEYGDVEEDDKQGVSGGGADKGKGKQKVTVSGSAHGMHVEEEVMDKATERRRKAMIAAGERRHELRPISLGELARRERGGDSDGEDEEDDGGGGFLRAEGRDDEGGEYMPEGDKEDEEHGGGGGFIPEHSSRYTSSQGGGGFVQEQPSIAGGGFIPGDDGGGFLPKDAAGGNDHEDNHHVESEEDDEGETDPDYDNEDLDWF